MRNASFFAVALLGSSALMACSFQLGGRTGTNTPAGQGSAAPAASTPTPAPAPTPNPNMTSTAGKIGRTRAQIPGTTPTDPGTSPGTTPPSAVGIPVLAGANIFGSGTPDASGWKGSYYAIAPATQKVPALATMTPTGVLFAKELNVSRKPMTGGFPGIDASRNENFAIRFEAPLIVDNEGDYTFRLVSEDGSTLQIDGTPILDNDGTRDNVAEKSGPVHLVKGTHSITVDYFQSTGQVALQLYCKKAGGAETVCPTKL
ncbi:MAG: hypothetical protein JST00_46140 [Deltaproteobacteria bacterium]|nr:hypothetical protein [Deltaproteobacteria bacterium]